MKPSTKTGMGDSFRSFPTWVALLIAAVIFSPLCSALAEQAPNPVTNETARFKADDDAVKGKAIGSVVTVLFLIGAVFVLAQWYQRRNNRLPTGQRRLPLFKVIETRRVSPRLSIVAVEISNSRTVILADNGQALLILDSVPSETSEHLPESKT